MNLFHKSHTQQAPVVLLSILVVMILSLASPAYGAAVQPHASWSQAPLANGFGAGVYDVSKGKLVDLWTHPYAQATASETTPDLLYDAFFGVASPGGGFWLTSVTPITAYYENGTGILVVVREVGTLRFTERWFSPMGTAAAVEIGVITVKNMGTSPVTDLKLFSLHNFHVGPGAPEASSSDETIARDAATGAFVETGTGNRIAVARPLAPATHYQASPPNPYTTMPANLDLSDTLGTGPMSDAVSAFQWTLPNTIQPGEEWSQGVILAVADKGTAAAILAVLAGISGSPDAVLASERAGWNEFHNLDVLPDGLVGDRLALARQSLAWLRMAQVREPNVGTHQPFGQILASLPPGGWNRTWVRDQAYAAVALSTTGHPAEAANAARFIHNAQVGDFEAQVGAPYGVSVCRYYGDGIEESDGNPDAEGPNIEFDGFGLQLWLAHEVAHRSPSTLSAAEAWEALKSGAADVLVGLIQPDGLVTADSGIWERHWNGHQKHFTNTDATAVLGLCAAADLAADAGDTSAEVYRNAARRVASAMGESLVSGGVLWGNLEEMASGLALDAAAIEAFNWDILPADGPVATGTLQAFQDGLGMTATGHGFHRNDDGDQYDRQEWVFIDLRMALALFRAGDTARAEALVDWVVAQSRANLDLISELYDETTADYAGAVPMGGFGAGAYLLWLTRHQPLADVGKCIASSVSTSDDVSDSDVAETGETVVPDTAFEDAPTPDAAVLADPDADVPVASPDEDIAPVRHADGCVAGSTGTAWPLMVMFLLLVMPYALRRQRA